jgi:hypothetical protein
MDNRNGSNVKHARVYDFDEKMITSHDGLIAKHIGFYKYEKFILRKFETYRTIHELR